MWVAQMVAMKVVAMVVQLELTPVVWWDPPMVGPMVELLVYWTAVLMAY